MSIAISTTDVLLDPAADAHTHSAWSTGSDVPELLLAAAEAAGLAKWGLTDRVRRDTTWLPDYARVVRALGSPTVQVRCGVETTLLDLRGGLDLPQHLPRLDYLVIVSDAVPGVHGPVRPCEVVDDIARGRRTAESVVTDLVSATVAAVRSSPFPPVVGRLFSVLGTCGLSQDYVSDQALDTLVRGLRSAQAAVAIGERSRVPSPRIVRALAEGGVRLVAGSDATRADEVGRWSYVVAAAAAVNR